MANGSFPFLLLILLPIILCTAAEQPKKETQKKDDAPTEEILNYSTSSLATIVCLILNLATLGILYMALREARRTPELLSKYRLSMHWLSRTAIRHSIGPNAKKVLVEFVEKEEKEKKEKKK